MPSLFFISLLLLALFFVFLRLVVAASGPAFDNFISGLGLMRIATDGYTVAAFVRLTCFFNPASAR